MKKGGKAKAKGGTGGVRPLVRPKSSSVLMRGTRAHVSQEARAEMQNMRERVMFLEADNKKLRQNLSALKRAHAPMIRVVKRSTKFCVQKKSTAPPDFPVIDEAENKKLRELEVEVAGLKARLESVMKQCNNQVQSMADQLLAGKEKEEEMISDLQVLVNKVRKHQVKETANLAENEALRKKVKELEARPVGPAEDPLQLRVMEEVRQQLLQELYQLKRQSHTLHSNFTSQKQEMQRNWREREDHFVQQWDEREMAFKDHIAEMSKPMNKLFASSPSSRACSSPAHKWARDDNDRIPEFDGGDFSMDVSSLLDTGD